MTNEVDRLLEGARGAAGPPISNDDLAELPGPVARYLNLAGVAGKLPPRTVHLWQTGTMRTAPGRDWVPLEAEQWFSIDPPAFVWHGSIRPAPLLCISAVDRFLNGHGSLRISAWGKIPVSTMAGPESDSGELLRFLVESIWFPAFLATPQIEWQAIEEHAASVSLRVGEVGAVSRMLFGDDGLIRGVEAMRYRSAGKRFELTPWSGRCEDYREANGVLIPHRIAVTWGLPQGDFEWFRVSIARIDYA